MEEIRVGKLVDKLVLRGSNFRDKLLQRLAERLLCLKPFVEFGRLLLAFENPPLLFWILWLVNDWRCAAA